MEAFIGTPEEYLGAYTLRCEDCGDDFDSYERTDKFCELCVHEQHNSEKIDDK